MSWLVPVVAYMALFAATAALSAGLIRLLMPMLRQYALARPNARSSHTEPTPQGAGMAVVAMPVLALLLSTIVAPSLSYPAAWTVAGAAVILALVGAIDDVHPLHALLRLPVHIIAAAFIVGTLPADARALPLLPGWVEAAVLVVGLVWFINLTNFMDGIDGITIAEMAPLALLVAMIAALAGGPLLAGAQPAAIALAGGLAGFAPYNKHKAKVFLGDVGSLAIGALAGWMLILVAIEVSLAAALLIPLYYLADATLTLFERWQRGERLDQAHRSHAYQMATQRGFTVPEVTGQILALNCALGLLALIAAEMQSTGFDVATVAVGGLLTAGLLHRLKHGRAT